MDDYCYVCDNDEDDLYLDSFSLNGVRGEFDLVDSSQRPVTDDQGWEFGTDFFASYYNRKIDCQIVLIENRILNEPKEQIAKLLDYIPDDVFDYLTKQLQIKCGVRIWITQQYGEMSDVIIVKDYFGEGTAISNELMDYLMEKAKVSHYKYVEIECGCISPIKEVKKC